MSGHSTREFYGKHLKQTGAKYEKVFIVGTQRHNEELPAAWIKYEGKSFNIKRVAVGMFHPGFLRERGRTLGDALRYLAFRERLIDFVTVTASREVLPVPSFPSSTLYWFQVSAGTIIPLQVFEDFVN